MGRTTQAAGTALLLVLLPAMTAAQSVNMGDTFHALEARARRITATFPDAVIEVRRTEARGVDAVVRDRGGVDRGRLEVSPGLQRVLWHRGPGGAPQEFALPDQTTISLDWAAHQLYALFADDRAVADTAPIDVAGDEGTWDGHVRRSRRALTRGQSSGQLAARLESVETEFDQIVVRATIDRHARRSSGARIDYSKFTATIQDARTGARRGFVRWFDTAQVLTWKIEGGSQGVVLPERLRGGWTFTPTMAWANVQAYQFATQAARALPSGDPFARAMRGLFERPANAAPLGQVARAIAPVTPLPALAWSTLDGGLGLSRGVPRSADATHLPGVTTARAAAGGVGRLNDEGCDRLHWLDGSIFRACCDAHDQCYEKNGCSEGSWFWPFSSSWSCQRCNARVVYCFCTMADPFQCGGGGSNGGDGGSDSGGCTSVAGGFCPIECQTCQAR